MRLTRIQMEIYARRLDLDLEVRGRIVIVGANDVGKTFIFRLLNLTLGTTAQLYQSLSVQDVRDPEKPLGVNLACDSLTDDERRLFHCQGFSGGVRV
ncbi:hypothetical protein FB472_1233 [Rhodoglobus vestalii]|uniref:Uncharacterized protein n=1 Tax=Rhodoglobus vestalii TaxID=193384 RepID=A0A8H2K6B3_9MICO|nr:hypothetical protein [Rhodoglobus vestalii]TQO19662.1 hypothetical protein FB472_1233 [Rhodoglobus vestalii]